MSNAKSVWGRPLLLCGLLHFSVVSSTVIQQESPKFSVICGQRRMNRGKKATSISVIKTQTNLSWNLPIGRKVLALLGTPTLRLFNISKNVFLNTCILNARICVCYLSMGQGPNVSHCDHTHAKPKTCSSQANQVWERRLRPMPRTRTRYQRQLIPHIESLLCASKASRFGALSCSAA